MAGHTRCFHPVVEFGGGIMKKSKRIASGTDRDSIDILKTTPNNAFDLENAVAEWTRQLRRSSSLEDGAIAELKSHLQDEIDDLILQGRNPQDAFREVTAAVESVDAIGNEYRKTDVRGLFATSLPSSDGFSPALLFNSIKVSFRKMRRRKWYSLISITGLGIGMASFLLIMIWIRHEMSYDRFHSHASRIHRVIMEDTLNDGISLHPWLPYPLGAALKQNFPEIDAFTRWRPDNMVVRFRDKSYTETGFLIVDPNFFDIFSFPFIEGAPALALKDPHSIVIRDKVVNKYFGDEDPLGKIINMSGRADLTVSGVVHIPDNSDFQYDFFFTFQSYPLFNIDMAPLEANWSGKNYHVYLLLKEDSSPELLENKISGFLKSHTPGKNEILHLQKLSRIHLFHPDGSDNLMRFVRIFFLIAVFILLIACVNFINLITARFEGRAKEVGLRKTLGGTRGQLIRHFFIESLFHSFLAMVAALFFVSLSLPGFNRIIGHRLSFDLSQADLLFGLFAVLTFTGFISGIYPALYLSSFAPIKTVRGFLQAPERGAVLRRILVSFQFTLSLLLIIGTIIVNSQVSHIMNRDLGIEKEYLVYHLMQSTTRDSVDTAREELLRHPDISGVTSCSHLPSNIISWIGYLDWEGRTAEQEVYPAFLSVDHDFIKTAGLTLVQGRDFSRSRPSDVTNFIINETAHSQLGVEDPIGLELRFWGQKGQIVGVVKDFINRHMASPAAPIVMATGSWGANRNYLLLRLRPGDPAMALQHFRMVWGKLNPGFPCEYDFLDGAIGRMYTKEVRLTRILFSFAILAVLISCLGLIGLSSYLAEEKTKEIGIRKVLGASSWKIISLLAKNFTRLVIFANIIAWPLGYAIMHRWLQDYAYRTPIRLWIFFLAGFLSLFVVIVSVGYQTLRAASADPVVSLRYE